MNTQHKETGGGKTDVYSRPSIVFDERGSGLVEVRMSAAAGDCRRALFYEAFERSRRGSTRADAPRDIDTQIALDAGNALEPVALRWLAASGWEVAPNDESDGVQLWVGEDMLLEGHHDALGRDAFAGGDRMVIEVKTRGSDAFRRWQTLGAERSSPEAVAQVALYTYATFGAARDAVLLCMDVGERACDYEIIPAERIELAHDRTVERMVELESALRSGPSAIPDPDFPPDHWRCRRCPFAETCGNLSPPAESESGAEVTESELRAAMAEFEQADAAIRSSSGEWQGRRKAAQAVFRRYLAERGQKSVEVEGAERTRKITRVRTRRYSVDHKALNALLSPEEREGIVRESLSDYVRVS